MKLVKFKKLKLFAYLMFWVCIIYTVVTPVQARSLAKIKKTKELRVCIAPYHPSAAVAEPKDCRDNCKFSGPIYEEVLAFAKTIGDDIQSKFFRVNWDEQFFNKEGKTVREASYTPSLLASEKCDLYPSNVTKKEWRSKKLDFVTLFPSRMMVIAQKSQSPKFKKASDLAGKVAAIEKDTSWHSWLQNQNQTVHADNPIKIILMTTTESLKAVDSGKVDFTLADSDMAIWTTRYELKNSAVVFPVGATDHIGWAFSKQDKDLQQAVQQFFDAQRSNKNSDLNQIWGKYFGMSLTHFTRLMSMVK